jgi:hypothetical protein
VTTSGEVRGAQRRRTGLRGVLLAPAGVALLSGLDAALLLLGLPAPVTATRLPEVHGMLMVLGFLGTLIALERAGAVGRGPAYAAPASLGLGALLLLSPLPLLAGQLVLVAGAASMLGNYLPLWRRQQDDAVLVQALGAVLALGAAVLWAGGVPVPTLLPWLVGFVVLTIAGERLELARIGMGPTAGPVLVLLACAVLAAVVAALLWPVTGAALLGAALLALTGWLAAHDVAWHTVRSVGLPRYMASCLLAAYVWLAVAGTAWLVGGPVHDGVRYDAVVHAAFLGFAISMVMAHAPVILPAVLRRALPYRPVLYLPVALLHGSLALRLWVGDALGSRDAWLTGGLLNIVALLAFMVAAAWSSSRPAMAPTAVPARIAAGAR